MLYVIGLGLSDEKDITVKGLEVGGRLLETIQSALTKEGSSELREDLPGVLHLHPDGPYRAPGA